MEAVELAIPPTTGKGCEVLGVPKVIAPKKDKAAGELLVNTHTPPLMSVEPGKMTMVLLLSPEPEPVALG